MFEEGNLLFFRPFLFKNGAEPQNKFFLVLKKMEVIFCLPVCLHLKTMYHQIWWLSMDA